MSVAIATIVAVTLLVGLVAGFFLERDRIVRFPTPTDRTPSARVIRRKHRGQLADLRRALRRPS